MTLLIAFLTFILVVNCLFLILLVLVQLPKKEAGAGLAFGAGAVDTLIGAGSGNALTKMTKYTAAFFIGLSVLLAVLNSQQSQSGTRGVDRALSQKASAAPMLSLPPAPAPTTGTLANAAAQPDTNAAPAAQTNLLQPLPGSGQNTNAPVLTPAPAQPQGTAAPAGTPQPQ